MVRASDEERFEQNLPSNRQVWATAATTRRRATVEDEPTPDLKTYVKSFNPHKLRLLEMNARYMRHETFHQLIENLKRDGELTQLPFAILERELDEEGEALGAPRLDEDGEGIYTVLSGNHRVMASREAGLTIIQAQVTDSPLTRQQRVAIQLSHNAISGEDDPAVLRQLYETLDVDRKSYSGLDDKTLELLAKVSVDALNEANLTFQTMTLIFLPDEVERVEKAFKEITEQAKASKAAWTASMRQYDDWLDRMDEISAAYDVKNAATAMLLMLKIVEAHIADAIDGWLIQDGAPDGSRDNYVLKHARQVPIATVMGGARLPAQAALTIRRALDRMAERGEITRTTLWAGLEAMANTYLGEKKKARRPRPGDEEG